MNAEARMSERFSREANAPSVRFSVRRGEYPSRRESAIIRKNVGERSARPLFEKTPDVLLKERAGLPRFAL